jgi:hypothetical protein
MTTSISTNLVWHGDRLFAGTLPTGHIYQNIGYEHEGWKILTQAPQETPSYGFVSREDAKRALTDIVKKALKG